MTALSLDRIVADALAEVGLKPALVGRPRRTVWSKEQPGFGMREYVSGRRVYVVQAAMHGTARTVTLCNVSLLGRRDALQLARRILLRAQVGENPAEERKRVRSTPSFAGFLETYWTKVAPSCKASTRIAHDKYRRLYLDRAFAGRSIDEIDDDEVIRRFADITRRGSPGAANRTLCVLRAVFNRAIEWGRRPTSTNPIRAVRRNRRRKLERHLSDVELRRLGAVLEDMEPAWPLHVAVTRLLFLTGCRRGEIVGLRWSEVRGSRLLLADSKTGPRTVWLGKEARGLLDRVPRHRGVADVFRDSDAAPPIDLARFWQLTRARPPRRASHPRPSAQLRQPCCRAPRDAPDDRPVAGACEHRVDCALRSSGRQRAVRSCRAGWQLYRNGDGGARRGCCRGGVGMSVPPLSGDAQRRETPERPLKSSVTPSDLKRMVRAIASLSTADREVFLAHRLDGLPFERIAFVTGFPVIDIERRVARAIAAIDRELCHGSSALKARFGAPLRWRAEPNFKRESDCAWLRRAMRRV